MAKVMVCDICLKDGKLTKSEKYFRVKGRADLRIDYCEACRPRIPKAMKDYVKFAYSMHGIELKDEEVSTFMHM
jgi:hypothetical protein